MIARYQTEAMAALWSPQAVLERMTRVELEVCRAWSARGRIPEEVYHRIRDGAVVPTPERVREIEQETNHDVVAFVRAMGEPVDEAARGYIHLGLTSSDVLDTAQALGLRDSVTVLLQGLDELLGVTAGQAREHVRTACAGRTHGMHAEPTSFGVRVAGWHAELLRNRGRLEAARDEVAHGKLSGAVGTFSQCDPAFEACVLEALGLRAEPVATQVVPRDRLANLFSTLALLGACMERIATELRALQRTEVGEVCEAFAAGQTGSSAMPHKKNPITAERLCGMARLLRGYMLAAHEDVALWHDRDISHSSVERVAVPDAFHLVHYMLRKLTDLLAGLVVDRDRMRHNMELGGGTLFSQSVLSALVDKGLERQEAYVLVQRAAHGLEQDAAGGFRAALEREPRIGEVLSPEELDQAFDIDRYLRHAEDLLARAGIPSEGASACRP